MNCEGDCVEESDEVSEKYHHKRIDRHLLGHHVASLVDTDGEKGQQYSQSGNPVHQTLLLSSCLHLLQNARLFEEKVVDHGVFLQIKFGELLHLIGVAPGLPVYILLTRSHSAPPLQPAISHLSPHLLEAGADRPPPGGGGLVAQVLRAQGYGHGERECWEELCSSETTRGQIRLERRGDTETVG